MIPDDGLRGQEVEAEPAEWYGQKTFPPSAFFTTSFIANLFNFGSHIDLASQVVRLV